MGIRICSLSSGSSGNCVFVSTEKSKFLIDAGIPLSRIEKCLKLFGTDLSEVDALVTHTHSDHIKYIDQLAKVCKSVSCGSQSAFELERCVGNKLRVLDGDCEMGDVLVSNFAVSHDVPCKGYSFYHKSGKISVATDLGMVDDRVCDCLMGSDIVMLESNHDPKMLANSKYPPFLKKRILSTKGHLSNYDCASLALKLACGGAKQFLLAHLSKENNTPQLAYNTVAGELEANGIVEGEDVSVEVALQDRLSAVYELS